MSITRRRFMEVSAGAAAAAFADQLFGVPVAFAQSSKPSAELTKLAEVALSTARKLGATYADIRINRYRTQEIGLRTVPDRDSGKLNNVPSVEDFQTFGFGVRVIAKGTWGFAASPIVNADEIARVARAAVAVAKANSALTKSPVR